MDSSNRSDEKHKDRREENSISGVASGIVNATENKAPGQETLSDNRSTSSAHAASSIVTSQPDLKSDSSDRIALSIGFEFQICDLKAVKTNIKPKVISDIEKKLKNGEITTGQFHREIKDLSGENNLDSQKKIIASKIVIKESEAWKLEVDSKDLEIISSPLMLKNLDDFNNVINNAIGINFEKFISECFKSPKMEIKENPDSTSKKPRRDSLTSETISGSYNFFVTPKQLFHDDLMYEEAKEYSECVVAIKKVESDAQLKGQLQVTLGVPLRNLYLLFENVLPVLNLTGIDPEIVSQIKRFNFSPELKGFLLLIEHYCLWLRDSPPDRDTGPKGALWIMSRMNFHDIYKLLTMSDQEAFNLYIDKRNATMKIQNNDLLFPNGYFNDHDHVEANYSITVSEWLESICNPCFGLAIYLNRMNAWLESYHIYLVKTEKDAGELKKELLRDQSVIIAVQDKKIFHINKDKKLYFYKDIGVSHDDWKSLIKLHNSGKNVTKVERTVKNNEWLNQVVKQSTGTRLDKRSQDQLILSRTEYDLLSPPVFSRMHKKNNKKILTYAMGKFNSSDLVYKDLQDNKVVLVEVRSIGIGRNISLVDAIETMKNIAHYAYYGKAKELKLDETPQKAIRKDSSSRSINRKLSNGDKKSSNESASISVPVMPALFNNSDNDDDLSLSHSNRKEDISKSVDKESETSLEKVSHSNEDDDFLSGQWLESLTTSRSRNH